MKEVIQEMINEERLKSMTREEMAHFLSGITGEVGYDLHGAIDFQDYINQQVCSDMDICPISRKMCMMHKGIDDSCPYEPWQRVDHWLSMPSDKKN